MGLIEILTTDGPWALLVAVSVIVVTKMVNKRRDAAEVLKLEAEGKDRTGQAEILEKYDLLSNTLMARVAALESKVAALEYSEKGFRESSGHWEAVARAGAKAHRQATGGKEPSWFVPYRKGTKDGG